MISPKSPQSSSRNRGPPPNRLRNIVPVPQHDASERIDDLSHRMEEVFERGAEGSDMSRKLRDLALLLDQETREKNRLSELNVAISGELAEVRRAQKDMQTLYFQNVKQATEQMSKSQDQRSAQINDLLKKNTELERRLADSTAKLRKTDQYIALAAEKDSLYSQMKQKYALSRDEIASNKREIDSLRSQLKDFSAMARRQQDSRNESDLGRVSELELRRLREQLMLNQEMCTRLKEEVIRLRDEKQAVESLVSRREEQVEDLREAAFKEKELRMMAQTEKRILEIELANKNSSEKAKLHSVSSERDEGMQLLRADLVALQSREQRLVAEIAKLQAEKQALESSIAHRDMVISELKESLLQERRVIIHLKGERRVLEMEVNNALIGHQRKDMTSSASYYPQQNSLKDFGETVSSIGSDTSFKFVGLADSSSPSNQNVQQLSEKLQVLESMLLSITSSEKSSGVKVADISVQPVDAPVKPSSATSMRVGPGRGFPSRGRGRGRMRSGLSAKQSNSSSKSSSSVVASTPVSEVAPSLTYANISEHLIMEASPAQLVALESLVQEELLAAKSASELVKSRISEWSKSFAIANHRSPSVQDRPDELVSAYREVRLLIALYAIWLNCVNLG